MRTFLTLTCLLVFSACGAIRFFTVPSASRGPSSIEVSAHLVLDELDEKLSGLYYYQVLAQIELAEFDKLIPTTSLQELYSTPAYLKLQANRAQVDEIEHEIVESLQELKSVTKRQDHDLIQKQMLSKIKSFAQESHMKSLAIENLLSKIGEGPVTLKRKDLGQKWLNQEYESLRQLPHFQVFENNIEHLSFMMESRLEKNDERFKPSSGKAGNISGFEFPAKVWSLTFDDGPKKETTLSIVENLKKHKLKATFFQLTNLAKKSPELSEVIRDAGMEIASHSYSHLQLTKVGPKSLEKEITQAVKELAEYHQRQIKFFRLPYGAGVNNPEIRQKIAANDLIHVFWNVDTLDWVAQEPTKIIQRTLALMKKTSRDQGVLLFHDVHQRTVEATPKIMEYLNQENRRVCKLEEIIQQMNEGLDTVCSQR